MIARGRPDRCAHAYLGHAGLKGAEDPKGMAGPRCSAGRQGANGHLVGRSQSPTKLVKLRARMAELRPARASNIHHKSQQQNRTGRQYQRNCHMPQSQSLQVAKV